MTNLRINCHPITGEAFEKAPEVIIYVDGRQVTARKGDSLAAALWANGFVELRRDDLTDTARSLYCGIGHCHECRMTVDGCDNIRSCLTPVRDGMKVSVKIPGDAERSG